MKKSQALITAGGMVAAALIGLTAGTLSHSETTPQACIDAVDGADRVIAISAEGFGYASDAFYAAASFDLAGMERAQAGLDRLTPQVEAAGVAYRAAADECTGRGWSA